MDDTINGGDHLVLLDFRTASRSSLHYFGRGSYLEASFCYLEELRTTGAPCFRLSSWKAALILDPPTLKVQMRSRNHPQLFFSPMHRNVLKSAGMTRCYEETAAAIEFPDGILGFTAR